MNKLTRTILFTAIITTLSLVVFPAAAQIGTFNDCDDLGIQCGSGNAGSDIVRIVVNIVNVLLSVVALIAAIFIIWGGFQYITSGGDENKAESAKRTILYAVVGLIIIGLSALIVNFVINAIQGRR